MIGLAVLLWVFVAVCWSWRYAWEQEQAADEYWARAFGHQR